MAMRPQPRQARGLFSSCEQPLRYLGEDGPSPKSQWLSTMPFGSQSNSWSASVDASRGLQKKPALDVGYLTPVHRAFFSRHPDELLPALWRTDRTLLLPTHLHGPPQLL